MLCEPAIILFTGSAHRSLYGRSVHTSGSGGVTDLQSWAADNEGWAEWTLRRRLQEAAKGGPKAAGATTGPLPPGEVHIPQRCKHLRVRMLSPIPFFTKISRNFCFQEIYPPGIPGGSHFHHTSNYWKICWDQNCGEWRDRTLWDSYGKDPEPFSWISVFSSSGRLSLQRLLVVLLDIFQRLSVWISPPTAHWGLDTFAAAHWLKHGGSAEVQTMRPGLATCRLKCTKVPAVEMRLKPPPKPSTPAEADITLWWWDPVKKE